MEGGVHGLVEGVLQEKAAERFLFEDRLRVSQEGILGEPYTGIDFAQFPRWPRDGPIPGLLAVHGKDRPTTERPGIPPGLLQHRVAEPVDSGAEAGQAVEGGQRLRQVARFARRALFPGRLCLLGGKPAEDERLQGPDRIRSTWSTQSTPGTGRGAGTGRTASSISRVSGWSSSSSAWPKSAGVDDRPLQRAVPRGRQPRSRRIDP